MPAVFPSVSRSKQSEGHLEDDLSEVEVEESDRETAGGRWDYHHLGAPEDAAVDKMQGVDSGGGEDELSSPAKTAHHEKTALNLDLHIAEGGDGEGEGGRSRTAQLRALAREIESELTRLSVLIDAAGEGERKNGIATSRRVCRPPILLPSSLPNIPWLSHECAYCGSVLGCLSSPPAASQRRRQCITCGAGPSYLTSSEYDKGQVQAASRMYGHRHPRRGNSLWMFFCCNLLTTAGKTKVTTSVDRPSM